MWNFWSGNCFSNYHVKKCLVGKSHGFGSSSFERGTFISSSNWGMLHWKPKKKNINKWIGSNTKLGKGYPTGFLSLLLKILVSDPFLFLVFFFSFVARFDWKSRRVIKVVISRPCFRCSYVTHHYGIKVSCWTSYLFPARLPESTHGNLSFAQFPTRFLNLKEKELHYRLYAFTSKATIRIKQTGFGILLLKQRISKSSLLRMEQRPTSS